MTDCRGILIELARKLIAAMFIAAMLIFVVTDVAAAEAFAVSPSDAVSPEHARAMARAQRRAAQAGGQPPGQPGNETKPGQEAKPDDKDKIKNGEGDDKKKEEAGDSVKRPEKPPRVPDPREFEIALDEKGRVPPFNFIGQPWPDVLQWLANISKSSLDWQELPNDYLNLTTQRSYTLDEVHNLINRHLHARGYTSIRSGEVLSVFKIDKLDPSLVRRVAEDELYDHKAYDYVKTSFALPAGMEVDKAKDDVKQLLSPNAKVFPLVTTRRLLVMDSVANLRTVSELLNQERMVQDGRIVPKEFVLRHARPEQVIEILYVILGVDPQAKPAQTDPRIQQQQMQMMQQMQEQGKDISKLMPKSDAPKVFLAYNRQRNSVLANAPPEQMRIIEQTIEYLDVPYGGTAAGAPPTALDTGERTMRKYQLTTLDPENLMTTLAEIGGLSPFAELRIDKKSKTLFALASEDDHTRINRLIDQFDGTGREFWVIPLRRHPADAVAATVFKLMGGQNEEEEDNNRRRSYWSWYDRDNDEDKEKPVKGFGVDADIENNRLLLWASETEMGRVRDLLIKLGEIPSGQQDSRPVRFIQPVDKEETAELLKRLRDAWTAAGGNELIIKAPPTEPPADKKKAEQEAGENNDAKKATDRSTSIGHPPRVAAHFAQLEATGVETDGPDAAEPTDSGQSPTVDKTAAEPPITISVTEDGRLMLSSPDTAALDRLEGLIAELSPAEPRFKVYRLKHIRAVHMYWDLTDYFADDLKEESSGYTRDWYGFMIPKGDQDQGGVGLSKRRKLMITYDVPNNAILVANASPSQLAEIEQLIEEFDRPAPSDSVEVRETAAIKIHYSRPTIIANAVKEVYRDLLSMRDKEFDRGEQRDNQRASAERVTVINYGGSSSGGDSDRPSPLKVGFDGALSMGADDVSGVLIVSAQKGIFDDIVKMVRELDAEAAPKTTVRVHRVNGNVTAEALQKAINEAISKPWLGSRPEQTGTGVEGDRGRRDRDGDRDRGDRRRDRNND